MPATDSSKTFVSDDPAWAVSKNIPEAKKLKTIITPWSWYDLWYDNDKIYDKMLYVIWHDGSQQQELYL